jgi:peptidoglycan/xylan/chitin deacetylase (PgdA/CDA1 family)
MLKRNPVFRLVIQYMFWKTTAQTVDLCDVKWSTRRSVDLRNLTEREHATWECITSGERCSEEQRELICIDLGERLGVSYADLKRTRILSLLAPEEIGALPAAGIDVQLHTHRHRFPMDDYPGAAREILDNCDALATLVSLPSRHFCYPSGSWDVRQWPWLEAMSVRSAATCEAGLNDHHTPRYALKRFLDSEHIHQLEFEAELCGFQEAIRAIRKALMRS